MLRYDNSATKIPSLWNDEMATNVFLLLDGLVTNSHKCYTQNECVTADVVVSLTLYCKNSCKKCYAL